MKSELFFYTMKQNPDKHSDPAITQVPAPILYLT